LFLAIELSDELRAGLSRVRRQLEGRLSGWRWVRPENIHLTLRFLGEVPDDRVARHHGAWRHAAAGCSPVRLEIGGAGVFPPRGVPRILWCGVSAHHPPGEIARLAAAMEDAARAEGFAPERRPFRPHLTLARARRGERPTAPAGDSVGLLGEVEAREVVLFRSRLSPHGATYERVELFPLAAGQAGA
jgi:2'-5' RNA ligase